MIEAQRENLNINKLIAERKEIILAEGDMIVPDSKPDILNTIGTSGIVSIYKKEVQSEKVRLDGTVNAYIMYMPDGADDTVRGLNTSVDFSENLNIPNCQEGMEAISNIKIKSIEAKVINGRKIGIKATLEVNLKIYSNEEVEIINEIQNEEDVQILKEDLKLNSLVGTGTTKIYAKDNIQIDSMDNLAEILQAQVCLVDKDIKISYNKVVAKSEISAKILYLTDDGKINYVEKVIPIMGFIDMENVTEENICDVKYCMKNILVKLNNTDENSIYVEIEVEISCYSYETKDIELIQDVYTPFSNIEYNRKTIKAMVGLQNINDKYTINEQILSPEISNSRIYNVSTTTNINNIKIVGSKAIYEGEAFVNILYESTEVTRIDKKEFKFPINYEIDILEGMNEENLDIMLELENYNVSSQGDNIQVNIELNISTKMFKTIELNIIDNVEEKELENQEEYSIIVYFVKDGDTLWNIAKKYRSTVENIKQINNIEDEDKLEINQQLFIPRYVEKVKAM